MTPEIVDYAADLRFSPLTRRQLAAVRSAAEKHRFEINADESALRFEYSGRDAGNLVMTFLDEIAAILKNAEGRIAREIVWSNDEETTDFYSIQDGKIVPAFRSQPVAV